MPSCRTTPFVLASLLVATPVLAPLGPSEAAAQVDARMFRYPDVSASQIAFVYAGDIWVVPKSGGSAARLTTARGEEGFPRFSPDGSRIAFTGNYDGNSDIYVVPSAGGEAQRITYHPGTDRLIDWYPDGTALLFASQRESGSQRFNQFYRIAATGGLARKLPVPYGEFASLSPDARRIVYTPEAQDFRTWKRYRGGDNADLWLFDLESYASENLTDSSTNDAQPMWHGNTIYFVSDRGTPARNNIWSYDPGSKQFRQHTRFTDCDITFPALGPSDIVFQCGGKLYLLALASDQVTEVKVSVVTDLATLRPRVEKVDQQIAGADLSPTGQRALFAGRGDVFTVPAEHGPVRNLTASSGVAERSPAWSPDGRLVAYFSDRSGEYELYVRPADGSGTEKKLTGFGPGFRYTPFWSPDSKRLAFIDQAMTIHIVDATAGAVTRVDRLLQATHGTLAAWKPSWSSDSRWLAYQRELPNGHTAIALFDTRTGKYRQVTSGFYTDFVPAFDPDGKYLFFLSNRTFIPAYSDLDNTWIYPNTTNVVAVPLRKDVPSPLAPRSDEEVARADSAKAATPGKADGARPATDTAKKAAPTPVEIDLDGFEQRLVVLPPKAGNYTDLGAVSGKVLYRRLRPAGVQEGDEPLVYWDLKDRKEETILEDVSGYSVSADGKKILALSKGKWGIVAVAAKQKLDKPLRTEEMEVPVDPRAEWKQLFADAWRFERDYFYEPGMHGVDWNAMRTLYGRMLDGAVTRWDVNWILGELIGELNASHTYRSGGDLEQPPQKAVGLLGIDWAFANGAYRVGAIIDGAPWDSEVRSPLLAPGVDVKPGDYILAVNGVPLDPAREPYAAFQGLAGKVVELTVNDRPTTEGARKVMVDALADESRLRNLAWIESNRKRVEELSGGRVAYVYVPNTGTQGQTELVRQFVAQFDKPGMIVDERFNSGGQIPDRFIELLNRPPLAFWAIRDGKDWQWPPVAHFGPKAMLINGWSGSGGDAFPWYFKAVGLGPLIGRRTWGGLIGISGVPALIDGGSVTVPTFRMYSPKGEWFPEGHGVEPDVEVVDDPTLLARGRDPQLERAVQEVLKRLDQAPVAAPKRPKYEDRSR
ncbi:MAG: S41 family peptidase [Gemmatimonadota bacterium]